MMNIYIYTYRYTNMYIYIERQRERKRVDAPAPDRSREKEGSLNDLLAALKPPRAPAGRRSAMPSIAAVSAAMRACPPEQESNY